MTLIDFDLRTIDIREKIKYILIIGWITNTTYIILIVEMYMLTFIDSYVQSKNTFDIFFCYYSALWRTIKRAHDVHLIILPRMVASIDLYDIFAARIE